MKSNDKTIGEVLADELKKSTKMRDAVRWMYYKKIHDDEHIIAFVSYEVFKGSWAYHQWIIKNKDKINNKIQSDNQRFGAIIWKTLEEVL